MTQPWNAARAASKRPLPKTQKMHEPIGPDHGINHDRAAISINGVDTRPQDVDRLLKEEWNFLGRPLHTCYKCGYTLCSCLKFHGPKQAPGQDCTYDVAGLAFSLRAPEIPTQPKYSLVPAGPQGCQGFCPPDCHQCHVRKHNAVVELLTTGEIKPKCIFCSRTGVHNCPGGDYWHPTIGASITGTAYPGLVDANEFCAPKYRRI